MHLWLLFLTGTTVYGIGRILEPSFEAVNFASPINGRRLTGNTIQEIRVDAESRCRVECVKKESCISYNFQMVKNTTEGYTCQISNSDRFVSVVNFTTDEDFKYVGMQVSPPFLFFEVLHKIETEERLAIVTVPPLFKQVSRNRKDIITSLPLL